MKWAICMKNDEVKASLELRKLYPLIEDEASAAMGFVRVIDESGEDYAFPASMFLPLAIEKPIEEQLLALAA